MLRRLLLFAFLVACSSCRSEGSSAGGRVKSVEQLKHELAKKEQLVAEAVAVGRKAPEFSLMDINGKATTLESFSGKLVLLNFWATWCVPCVDELPSLQRLHDRLTKLGFQVVAVAVDDAQGIDAVKKFVKDNQITMPVLLDPEGTLPAQLGISGFPESFFIGPDGTFVSVVDSETAEPAVRFVGERAWDSRFLFEQIEKSARSFRVPGKG